MHGSYDLQLVALSVLVAVIASYTALELAGRISRKRGAISWLWLVGGAISLGTGIWSMHFIGLLAFKLPVSVAYDVVPTMLSMAIGIAGSGLVLHIVGFPNLSEPNIGAGAVLMGLSISAMHYTGMHAMQMAPPIEYQPLPLVASIVIAIAASLTSLWMAFRFRHKEFGTAFPVKLGSASVMGIAIAGMHYTAMAAAQFAPGSISLAADSTAGMSNASLALVIGITTIILLTMTLALSALDAHVAANAARLAASLQEANLRLRDLALYDQLTGLPNRLLLDDRMAQLATRAGRTGKSFALMFVDLDHFKQVNDTFGHDVGDELLKAVALRLKGCIRKADTIARTGGDEFVVVLSDIAGPKDAAMVGRKILDELSRPFFIDTHEISVSASIGISLYPEDGREVSSLKSNADQAMYCVKRNGRNDFRFFGAALQTGKVNETGIGKHPQARTDR